MADLVVERTGHVVVVTMHRPEARNAFTPEMLHGMAEAWKMVDADPEVRVAVLTGAGGSFCAGADLKAMRAQQGQDPDGQRIRDGAEVAWRGMLRHHRLTKP